MIREYKLRDNVIVKLSNNQAEVIVENNYKLFLTLYENVVIAKYRDVEISVKFDKFDSEKLARKIHVIVKQSHRFSIILIKEVLELITIDNLYNDIIEEIKKLKEEKDINKLRKVYEFLKSV